MKLAIVAEVYQEMLALRLREMLRTDSARLAAAIRTVAERRQVRYQEIESDLDEALAFRVR